METDNTIAAALATLDQSFEGDGRTTIFPPEYATRSVVEAGRLVMGKTLGEGGMGIVRVARQSALEREVAVKTLRAEYDSEIFKRRLLQEAWTTGTLEHPNIVPVYDIQVDEGGAPLIVLKRIEGREWSEVIASGEAPEQGQDLLEWNLRTLMQVCRAIHFAHRRGFVHRDIKPENVMIGEFGEVYLLDWGISVATSDDGTGRFPLASDAHAMAGTPAYMAPEMLGGKIPNIGSWTDVYLLGAVLYELMSGRVPHDGETLPEILRSVMVGPRPEADEEPELWRICARAMDTDPAARFESAEQLRLAIEGFLQHRGARRLVARAERSLAIMREAIEQGDDLATDAAFAECRFGYRAALEAWPAFADARAQLREAELLMARAELAAGRPEAADRLLGAGDSVPPDLRAAVDAALALNQSERESMRRWRDDHNEDTGRRTRSFVMFVLATGWIIGPLVRPFFYRDNDIAIVVPYLIAASIAGGLFFWARDSLSRSRLNRSVAAIVGAVMVTGAVVAVVAASNGRDALWVEQTLPFVWLAGALVSMWMVSVSLWPTVLGLAAACYAVVRFPEWRNEISSAASTVLLINALYLNRSIRVLREILAERQSKRRGPADTDSGA